MRTLTGAEESGAHTAEEVDAKHLPLLVTEDGYVPLYLQLVHQIRHLITSRGLAADDRLPSVRELAQQLSVNAGTVALAYRTLQLEGLIESRRGRGTYVAHVAEEPGRFDERQRLLIRAIDGLLDRADALGFGPAEVKQYLLARSQRPRRMPIVVAMPHARGAEKYARLIAAELPAGSEPRTLTLKELAAGEKRVLDVYAGAYFTFTFASHAPTVAALLVELGIESEVVGITAQLTPGTSADLAALDPAGKYCLVSESTNANVALNVLAQFSPLLLGHLPVFTELSAPEEVLAAAPDKYLHTFTAGPQLDALGIAPERRLELVFGLSDEAKQRLHYLLVAAGPATAPDAQDVFLSS